jgi:hypothetical protein
MIKNKSKEFSKLIVIKDYISGKIIIPIEINPLFSS